MRTLGTNQEGNHRGQRRESLRKERNEFLAVALAVDQVQSPQRRQLDAEKKVLDLAQGLDRIDRRWHDSTAVPILM